MGDQLLEAAVTIDDGLHVADALTCAASKVMDSLSKEEALAAIALTAPGLVPGVGHASVSLLHRDGRFETVAATDDLARRADDARYGAGTWPWVGRGAWMALPLDGNRHGSWALNLYAPEVDEFDHAARHIAHLFAAHARNGLAKARCEDDLNQALSSRKEIGKAIGIVMERYLLNEDKAFGFLVRISRTRNVKLREVARGIVDAAERAHQAHGPRWPHKQASAAGGESSSAVVHAGRVERRPPRGPVVGSRPA